MYPLTKTCVFLCKKQNTRIANKFLKGLLVGMSLFLCSSISYTTSTKNHSIIEAKNEIESALRTGDLQTLKDIISNDVDYNATYRDGEKSLMMAEENERLKAVEFLAGQRYNLEPIDMYGRTILICAAEKGHLKVVKFLAMEGVNLEASDMYGKTALIVAAENGYLEVVKFLAGERANLEPTDMYGKTALIVAAEKRHLSIVAFLIKIGACYKEYLSSAFDEKSSSTIQRTLQINKVKKSKRALRDWELVSEDFDVITF